MKGSLLKIALYKGRKTAETTRKEVRQRFIVNKELKQFLGWYFQEKLSVTTLL